MPIFEFRGPDGKTHSIEGPEGATQEQAFQMLQKQLGGQSAPAAPQEEPSTIGRLARGAVGAIPGVGSVPLAVQALTNPADMAKSVASGLEQNTATVLGLPGDVATLARSVAPQSVVDKVKAIPGAKFLYDHLPTSEAILASSDPLVDPNYKPESRAGQLVQRIARNASAGPVAAVGAGVVGQAAFDVTGGNHLAETGGEIAGGVLSPLALARASRKAIQPLKDVNALKEMADAQYADPLLRSTKITPQAASRTADDLEAAINANRSRFAPAQAPEVHAAIDRLGEASRGPRIGPPAPVSIEDLHSFRKTLGEMSFEQRLANPEQAKAAGVARRALDKYLDNIPSKDVVSGDPIDAVKALRDANSNWRGYSHAKDVENIIANALGDAAAQHSGMNIGNKLRQGFKPLAKDNYAQLRAMGYGDDVIKAVETLRKGDPLTNIIRNTSNVLGGGGGLGSLAAGHVLAKGTVGGLAGVAGYQEGGTGAGLAATALGMLPGQALRVLANKRTLNAAERVKDAMLSKAAGNARIVTANNAARAANAASDKQAWLKAARNAGLLSLFNAN